MNHDIKDKKLIEKELNDKHGYSTFTNKDSTRDDITIKKEDIKDTKNFNEMFDTYTINGTSINLGSSQKTKQLFKARARFCSRGRGTSIDLLPQLTCSNEKGRTHHFLCLRHELSMCINARPHKPP